MKIQIPKQGSILANQLVFLYIFPLKAGRRIQSFKDIKASKFEGDCVEL